VKRSAWWLAIALLLAIARASAGDRGEAYESWYPADITPPAGTEYPCALTALPATLSGVPENERRFVNHTYSMVLKSTQAKLVLLRALGGTTGLDAPLARYLAATDEARSRLAREPVPAGLEAFADDVRGAIERQQSFFRTAVARRAAGATWDELLRLPDGRAASQRLLSAWAHMQHRYPAWTPEVRDSVYHHLCALDLF
jgi:hypothetical protein